MTETPDFLIIDDDEAFAAILARGLKRHGYSVVTAHSRDQAEQAISGGGAARVVLDLKLGDASGLHLIPEILGRVPHCRIVVLTGYSSIPTTVEAIKLGAVNYLCKPVSVSELLDAFSATEGNAGVPLAKNPPSVERLEWEHIQRILAELDGNISATARALGMHRRTLQRKLQKRPVSD